MISRFGMAVWLFVMATMALFGALPLAFAQRPPLPESQVRVSTDKIVIRRQLQQAVLQSQKALSMLEGASDLTSREDLEDAHHAAYAAYVLIRAAREGISQAKEAKRFGDPMLARALREVTQAWDLARGPVDSFMDGISTRQYIDGAIPRLTESIRIVNRVLPLLL